MTTRGRRRRSFGSRSSIRRSLGWTQATLESTAVGASSTTTLDLLGALTVAEKARIHTILRVVGTIGTVADAVNTEVFGRWGIIRVTDTAMAGPTIPGPSAAGNAESSWMANTQFVNRRGSVDYVGAGLNGLDGGVDIRSKRRFTGDGHTLAFIITNSGAAMQLWLGFRLLYSWN